MSGVSVIVPAYRSAATLPELTTRIIAALERRGELEIIIVDDDSGDGTWEVIVGLAAGDARIRGVQLGRNAGQHSATLAGARLARFPVSVTLDDDLQNPPEEIGKLVDALVDGVDVVYGWATHVEHELWRRLASRMIRAVLRRSLGAARSVEMSSFRAYRTSLREAFTGNVGPAVTFDALLAWGTKRFSSVVVEHHPRAHGRSNYSLGRLVRFALDSVTGYSTAPLQLATTLGLFMAVFGAVLLAWVLGTVMIRGSSVSGFPFLASALSLFSGTQLFALGVIGEYLARMHRRVMSEPTYVIRETTP